MTVQSRSLISSKISPNDKQSQSTNVIGFEDRFYALSSQGTLAVVEEVGIGTGRFEITALGKTRAAPSVPSKGFRECLVESDGEILLVFLLRGFPNAVKWNTNFPFLSANFIYCY